jgi:hypothetical protein
VGLLGYKVKRVTLQGGWRYMVIHKRHSGESFVDLAMTGVVLGVVIPLKQSGRGTLVTEIFAKSLQSAKADGKNSPGTTFVGRN